jgi:hypothetical protein
VTRSASDATQTRKPAGRPRPAFNAGRPGPAARASASTPPPRVAWAPRAPAIRTRSCPSPERSPSRASAWLGLGLAAERCASRDSADWRSPHASGPGQATAGLAAPRRSQTSGRGAAAARPALRPRRGEGRHRSLFGRARVVGAGHLGRAGGGARRRGGTARGGSARPLMINWTRIDSDRPGVRVDGRLRNLDAQAPPCCGRVRTARLPSRRPPMARARIDSDRAEDSRARPMAGCAARRLGRAARGSSHGHTGT